MHLRPVDQALPPFNSWRSGARQPRSGRGRASTSPSLGRIPRGRGVAAEPASARRRCWSCSCCSGSWCCACGRSRWSRARATSAAVHAQPGAGRQCPSLLVARSSIAMAPCWPVQHPAGGDPPVVGRGGFRTPSIVGKVAAGRARRPQQVQAVHQQQPATAPRARPRGDRESRRRPSNSSRPTRATTPGSACRRSRSAPTPRAGPRGPIRLRRRHHLRATSRPPELRVTPRAARSACPGIEAQYEPTCGAAGRASGPQRRRQRLRWWAPLSTTAPQVGDTVVLNVDTGLQQTVQAGPPRRRSWPTATRSTGIDGRYPSAPQRRGHRDESAERAGAGPGLYPSYDLNEWVGGISTPNYTALQASGAENNYAIEGLYTRDRRSSS